METLGSPFFTKSCFDICKLILASTPTVGSGYPLSYHRFRAMPHYHPIKLDVTKQFHLVELPFWSFPDCQKWCNVQAAMVNLGFTCYELYQGINFYSPRLHKVGTS